MIDGKIIRRIKLATCAVLYMPVKHEKALAGVKPGSKILPPETQVMATGFLVREDLALTNRHVVEKVAADHNQLGHHDNWYVRFTYPKKGVDLSESVLRVGDIFALVDPAGKGSLDVGLIQFKPNSGEGFQQCQPVEFANLEDIAVGADIAICGFPFGNIWLVDAPGVRRFGPVVHQGIISAISPFDTTNPRNITTFLTDVNSAEGMSGSPVFLPENGKVTGLHYAGAVGTLGCAIPIDETRVKGWITFYEKTIANPGGAFQLKVSAGGDILED